MSKAMFMFGHLVVVEGGLIGVVVKTWQQKGGHYEYEVYVRSLNAIVAYEEPYIQHYVVSKELAEDEYEFYDGILEWKENEE